MSEKLRESLSASIDDEADEFELRRVLDEMEKDDGLRDTWERYHLIGAIMRGESERADADLRDSVWAALEMDPENAELSDATVAAEAGVATGGSAKGPWLGRATGLAVAASVAFAVVFGICGIASFDEDDQAGPAIAANDVVIKGPGLEGIQLTSEASASDRQRQNAYFLHHVQQKALNQPGVANFVKLVTYERR
jgi:sigma-E factor negative regulatory protein RseA